MPSMVTINPRMVTHQKEVNYRLGIWHLDLSHKTKTAMDGYLSIQIQSPNNPRMLTNQR